MNRWILLAALAMVAGCSATTETGYQPRRFDDSTVIQRGYYATPYSPEAQAAEAQRKRDAESLQQPQVEGTNP